MLARLGGDEFVILLPYTQQSQLEALGKPCWPCLIRRAGGSA
jgi:GGDEF domain-containing protein